LVFYKTIVDVPQISEQYLIKYSIVDLFTVVLRMLRYLADI